jgi:hypothetical protein
MMASASPPNGHASVGISDQLPETVKMTALSEDRRLARSRSPKPAGETQHVPAHMLQPDRMPTGSNLQAAIPDRTTVIVRVSLATELPRLLAALRSNRPGTLAVDAVVLDDSFAEWARGRREWTIRQRRCAEWPINSP